MASMSRLLRQPLLRKELGVEKKPSRGSKKKPARDWTMAASMGQCSSELLGCSGLDSSGSCASGLLPAIASAKSNMLQWQVPAVLISRSEWPSSETGVS